MNIISNINIRKFFNINYIVTVFILFSILFSFYSVLYVPNNAKNSEFVDQPIYNIVSNIFSVKYVNAQQADTQTGTTTANNETKDNGADVSLGFVGDFLKYSLYFILYVFGMLVKLGAFLTAAALKFNQSILEFDPPFVTIGWTIFRDIANLGFVFGIIVISISTILRIKSYRAQSILWKLIVAALLVNFSLVIAGSIMKTSDVFSNYFIREIGGGSTNTVALKLVNNFHIDEIQGKAPDGGSAIWKLITKGPSLFEITGMFVGVIIEALMFVVLLGLAVMLLLRYFYLSFLLLISPIVWLFWIFPTTNKYWKDWWNSFIHWTIFAPSILLFIWLTLKVMENSTAYYNQTQSAVHYYDTGGVLTNVTVGDVGLGFIMSSIMSMAMLVGGIKVSQSMGLAGASSIIGVAKKTGNWTKKKAISKTKSGVARAGNRVRVGEKLSNVLASKKIQNIPVLRGIAGATSRGLARVQAKADKVSQGSMSDFGKSLNGLGDKGIAKLLPTMRGERRAQAISMLASKNKLNKDAVESAGGVDGMLDVVKILKRKKQQKEASDVEKRFMSEDAMNASKIIMDENSSDEDKKNAKDSFRSAIVEQQKKFSPKDWASFAENIGGTLLSGDNIPGLDEEATKMFRDEYVKGVSSDLGRALGATMPRLKDKQVKSLYKSIIKNIGEIEYKDPQTGNTIKPKMDKLIDKAEETGDYSYIYNILEKSDDPKVKTIVKKMKTNMGLLMVSGNITGGNAKKPEDKKQDKK